jgi:hypothetical protein
LARVRAAKTGGPAGRARDDVLVFVASSSAASSSAAASSSSSSSSSSLSLRSNQIRKPRIKQDRKHRHTHNYLVAQHASTQLPDTLVVHLSYTGGVANVKPELEQ